MFDKSKFAQVLKNINDTYNSQRDFAKKSEINRTYLSQYMNMKLDKPPKPETLEKLANSSNNTITYEQLMDICGYIDLSNSDDINKELISLYDTLNELEKRNDNAHKLISTKEDYIENDLFEQVLSALYESNDTPETFNPYNIVEDLDFVPDYSKKKIANVLKEDFEYFYHKRKIEKTISDIKARNCSNSGTKSNFKPCLLHSNILLNQFYMCPVYGRIAAGQPNWAEECLESYLPIDPELMNIADPEECFFLRVNGESMNKVIKNGAFALIHKTDYVEDGDIVVALVNGDEATLKKFKRLKKSGYIMLEPQSTSDEFEPIIIDPKQTEIKILGKYIGKMEMK